MISVCKGEGSLDFLFITKYDVIILDFTGKKSILADLVEVWRGDVLPLQTFCPSLEVCKQSRI